MTPALSDATFALALLFYGSATVVFFVGILRHRPLGSIPLEATPLGTQNAPAIHRMAPVLLAVGALGHGAHVTIASFIAHVCPVHSVHFILSIASLLAIAGYLTLRRSFRIDSVGLIIAPLGLAFLLGTYFLGKPGPETKLSAPFIALHVLANLIGVALFLLAGCAAALYLIQEKRLKQKRPASRIAQLPALDTLDRAIHRFLIAGFPLLTLGIVTGTFWARELEMGTPNEIMRFVFGYATWLLIALVLLLRTAFGWRGRRAAYGTIAGLTCAMAVLVIYLVRPANPASGSEPRGKLPADTTDLVSGARKG